MTSTFARVRSGSTRKRTNSIVGNLSEVGLKDGRLAADTRTGSHHIYRMLFVTT